MNIFYGLLEDDKYHAEKPLREKGVEVFNFKQGFGGKPQWDNHICRKTWGSEELRHVMDGGGGWGEMGSIPDSMAVTMESGVAWHVCDTPGILFSTDASLELSFV